jgi:protein subunit release factor B
MSTDALHGKRGIVIAGWELSESFIRASGPGGQNVNKVATAVQLRFDIANSPSLTDRVKAKRHSAWRQPRFQGRCDRDSRGQPVPDPGAQSR